MEEYLDKANIGAFTESNLATSVDQILNLPNSSNYSPLCPTEESIGRFEERILQKHLEMKEQAKQEYGHPNLPRRSTSPRSLCGLPIRNN